MPQSPADYRILQPKRQLLGSGDGFSLENLIVDPLPDGALCFVLDQRNWYTLDKFSTALVAAPAIIATGRGAGAPGRWQRLQSSVAPAGYVEIIADLALIPVTGLVDGDIQIVLGSLSPVDRGGGMFHWDATSTRTSDNGIVVSPNPPIPVGRWIRYMDQPEINPYFWGGMGDYSPLTSSGGVHDNASVHSCRDYCVLNKTTMFTYDGVWLITAPVQIPTGFNWVMQSDDKTILFGATGTSVLVVSNNPIGGAPDLVFDVKIKGGSIIGTGTIAIDIISIINSEIKVGIAGDYDYGVASIYDPLNPSHDFPTGENYLTKFEVYDFMWRPEIHPFPGPPRPTNGLYLNGKNTNSNNKVSITVNLNGFVSGTAVYVNGGQVVSVTGAVGNNLVGIHMSRVSTLKNTSVYGEGNIQNVVIENCLQPTLDSTMGAVEITAGTRGPIIGNVLGKIFTDTTVGSITHVGGAANDLDYGPPIHWSNVGYVGLGLNFEQGLFRDVAGATFVVSDPHNLILNGDFRHWTTRAHEQIWGMPGLAYDAIKCGVGLVDTTQTNGSPFCAHIGWSPLRGGVARQKNNWTIVRCLPEYVHKHIV